MLNMIFAHCAHNIVAESTKGGYTRMPWGIRDQPGDLNWFRKTILASSNPTMIMGRKTFDTLNRDCLKGRRTIVISSKNFSFSDHLIQDIRSNRDGVWSGAFVIGGPEIWNLFSDQISTIYETEIFFDPVKPSAIDNEESEPELDEHILTTDGTPIPKWIRYGIENVGKDFVLESKSKIYPSDFYNKHAYQFRVWNRVPMMCYRSN